MGYSYSLNFLNKKLRNITDFRKKYGHGSRHGGNAFISNTDHSKLQQKENQ